MMIQDLIKRIGDRGTTSIWDDNWIPRDNFKRLITCLIAELPQKASELIDHTSSSWYEQRVRSVFIPMDDEAILKIPLCMHQVDDFWAWGEEVKGNFTVRSRYRMTRRQKCARKDG